ELGCGYGTYTQLLLHHGRVISVDIDQGCLVRLRERFRGRELETQPLDLNDHAAIQATSRWGFRSAFSTNVLEHIEDDEVALLDAPAINNQLRFYDRFVVPLARLTDFLFRPFFGLSVVAIARKAA